MREKAVEQRLIKEVRSVGGMAFKFVSPGFDGMPDRLVILPEGKIGFVEVKAPGKKPRPLQVSRMEMLKQLGCRAFVLDDISEIKMILREIGGDAK